MIAYNFKKMLFFSSTTIKWIISSFYFCFSLSIAYTIKFYYTIYLRNNYMQIIRHIRVTLFGWIFVYVCYWMVFFLLLAKTINANSTRDFLFSKYSLLHRLILFLNQYIICVVSTSACIHPSTCMKQIFLLFTSRIQI